MTRKEFTRQLADLTGLVPSQRPLLQRFFVRDPEGAIALVRALKPVRNVTSRRAPDGVDPRSFDLDRRIRAHAVQHGIPYAAAFDRVMETAA
jgi:hypothetical protein